MWIIQSGNVRKIARFAAMKRILFLLPLPLLFTVILACSQSPPSSGRGGEQISIGFYNVENLFDTQDDPNTDDEDFTPNGRNQWTEAAYQQKLKNLAQVISQLGDADGPELLGLGEVENRKVLEDLVAQETLKAHNYKIVHKDSPDHRGIDVALLYKSDWFEPEDIGTYTVELNDPEFPDNTTRDILAVTGKTKKGGELTVVVNHWSSRRGGEEATDFKRAAAARVARSIVDARMQEDKDAKVMLMGDFNDGPTDASVLEVLGGAKTVEGASRTGLYNPMYAMKDTADVGTYRYRGEIWNLFDQIILTRSLLNASRGWRYVPGSAAIYNPEFMCEVSGKYQGAPLKGVIGGKFRDNGQSDHFPVYIHLEN